MNKTITVDFPEGAQSFHFDKKLAKRVGKLKTGDLLELKNGELALVTDNKRAYLYYETKGMKYCHALIYIYSLVQNKEMNIIPVKKKGWWTKKCAA